MSCKITLPVEFELGTLDEIGLNGFKTTWLEATDEGRDYELTSGAGVGSPYLEGSVQAKDQQAVYAKADIRALAQELFEELTAEQDKVQADGHPAQ